MDGVFSGQRSAFSQRIVFPGFGSRLMRDRAHPKTAFWMSAK
jgi:hypothetical protein